MRNRASGAQGIDGFQFTVVDAPRRATALESEMRVFRRSARPDDALRLDPVDELLLESREASATSLDLSGSLVLSDARLVLADAGSSNASVYAMPNTNGWVCLLGTEDIGLAPLIRAFFDQGVTISISANPRRVVVLGALADDVQSVAVLLTTGAVPAQLGENAYFAELPPEKLDQVEGLRVRYATGNDAVIRLGRL